LGAKEDVIKLINELPESATTEDIMRKLYERIKIEKGIYELDEGRSFTHTEVKEKMDRWLK